MSIKVLNQFGHFRAAITDLPFGYSPKSAVRDIRNLKYTDKPDIIYVVMGDVMSHFMELQNCHAGGHYVEVG